MRPMLAQMFRILLPRPLLPRLLSPRQDRHLTLRSAPLPLPLSYPRQYSNSLPSSSPARHQDYTVGWISALPLELVAARAMLDESHGIPQEQHEADKNNYCLGRIGEHNVVLACLPKGVYGTNSAAKVAADMLHSFRSIRFGLMVGIGGGVPTEHDVRLGDIVVSSPSGTLGGVVQYDFGYAVKEGKLRRIGSLNKPPQVLSAAVARLESDHKLTGSRVPQLLEEIGEKYPKIRDDFKHPGLIHDRLYQAGYEHIGEDGGPCELCDETKFKARGIRENTEPIIHYGIIASANSLMMDASSRDRLGKELGVLCFEMEAAGLMDNFPCLVIRGICDYSDSHKNKLWQNYAAATAAAYAKELLGVIPRIQVEKATLAAEMVNAVKSNEKRKKILDWLSNANYGAQQSDFLNKREKGTGRWLLDSAEFKAWIYGTEKTLFCPGIPGSGKTILASTVIDHLLRTFRYKETPSKDYSTGIAFLYCSYRRREEQKIVDLLTDVLKQLLLTKSKLPEGVEQLYEQHSHRGTRPLYEEISELLPIVISTYSRVFIVVDALDECRNDGTCRSLLAEIRNLQLVSDTRLMATSRDIPHISQEFQGHTMLEVRAHREDVERYIDGQLHRLPTVVQENGNLLDLVRSCVADSAGSMFLLVHLYVEALTDKLTEKDVEHALATMPRGSEGTDEVYAEAYHAAMKRIEGQLPGFHKLAKSVLPWIIYARRPLTAPELQYALAVDSSTPRLNQKNLYNIQDIISSCVGLVTVDQESRVVRLVHYTAQEYFERVTPTTIPDAAKTIASTCLAYLLFEDFQGGGYYFENRAFYTFNDYAAKYWGDHARVVQEEVKREALSLLQKKSLVAYSSRVISRSGDHYDRPIISEEQATGLHLAAHFGLHMILKALLEDNTSADPKDLFGHTPLLLAAARGHYAVVKLLVDRDDVNADSKDLNGWTPLMWAAARGHENIVKLLATRSDTDADSKNLEGRTPLFWAAIEGKYAIVKLLVAQDGVTADPKDLQGRTPLSWAASEGHERIVKVLVEQENVDINSKDFNGRSPLLWAAFRGNAGIVRLLLEQAQTTIESKDSYGRTPLLWAAIRGEEAILELLVEHTNINLDSEDFDGRTPLSWAASIGHIAVVKRLLELGVNPSSQDLKGRTPLSWAASEGQTEVVKLLVECQNVEVDLKDEQGLTPLSWAAAGARETVVKILAERSDVDINSEDLAGRTPRYLAAAGGHSAIVELLESYISHF